MSRYENLIVAFFAPCFVDENMIISECETGDGKIVEGRLKFALQCINEGSWAAHGETSKFTGRHLVKITGGLVSPCCSN